MTEWKTLDVLLKDLGYISDYTLSKERDFLEDDSIIQSNQPLGQTIDIVIPTHGDKGLPSKQLIDILGTRYIATDRYSNNNNHNGFHNSNNRTALDHKYKHSKQLLADAMDEFLSTEENYIRKLQALVNSIVKPLKLSCAQDKQPILKQYMCTNIFLNLEQILDLHLHFMKDLLSCRNDFAAVCSAYMGKMERYRRYLLKVNDAHELHSTEYQKNQHYRSFIIKTITNPVFEKLSLKDLLDQPWKRITAYTLLIKDIRNYTSIDHPDFNKLTDAFTQINTIASVRDDVPTILATKSHDLYLSIRKAPCHLIKQSRLLVTHLDTIEINRVTGKLSRYVTLFLFSDKIMVASRSSHSKGVDICDDGRMTSGSSLAHLVPKKKKDLGFKFCGWVGLEHIDLIRGPLDIPASIVVRASSDFQDSITETGYEKYFQKGTRIFGYQSESSQQTLADFRQDIDSFVDTFYKTRAVRRQCGNQDSAYHRVWNNFSTYSNVYDYDTYPKVDLKSNVAAILMENDDSEASIPSLLNSGRSSPWIVALVRPDSQGLKLNFWTKITMSCIHQTTVPNDTQQVNFATIFWNNVIKCEQKLRCSSTYRVMNECVQEQEAQRPIRSRSRSRASMSNFSKFFGRSRSQPPFSSSMSSSASSASAPSLNLELRPSKSTPSHQHLHESNNSTICGHRSRAKSMSSDPLASSEATLKPTTTRRRKLSFDASFFKIDMKNSSSTLTTAQNKTYKRPPSPLQQHQQQNKSNCIIGIPTSTPVTSNLAHIGQQPPPAMFLSNQQAYHLNGNASDPTGPPPYSIATNSQKQRQLIEKLDVMYHEMAGISIEGGKDQQRQQQKARHTCDPLVSPRPSQRTSSLSTSVTSLSSLSSSQQTSYGGNFGTSSSRSSGFTNTFSSDTSQSSRSSLSLEEPDEQFKGYGPSLRLVDNDTGLVSNHPFSRDEVDDEIARKVISGLTNNKKRCTPKSLSPHYALATDYSHRQQQLAPTPATTMSTPMLMETIKKDSVFDNVAVALEHCSSQAYSRWGSISNKQRMLGNQVNRIANILPPGDSTGANMLTEAYRETMDESSNFFNKISTELEEISAIVNAYRQGSYHHHQQRNSSIGSNDLDTPVDANTILKRKLKEIQLERDYWCRRTSELTDQVTQLAFER